MHSRLVEILDEKHREVSRLKDMGLPPDSRAAEHGIRDFKGAISSRGRMGLIAEIKFASPSAGVIRKESDPLPIGRIYQSAGAAAISLLTDKKFFNGDLTNLISLKSAVALPVLRKDFIIDEIQVEESFLHGADALLLIARILSKQKLDALLAKSREFGLSVLTEVHDRADLQKAVDCGADIIGINNRDLDTFEVDVKTTMEIAPLVPEEIVLVSESGIKGAEDIRLLKNKGVNAVLVGSSLMQSDHLEQKTREMVGAGYV